MTTDEQTYDPWETDNSSGFFTDFEGTIADAFFQTDPRYQEGRSLLLNLVIDTDTAKPLQDGEVPEDLVIKLPVGKDWETEDGGRTASHPRSTTKKFHASSLYGKIIDSVSGRLEGYGSNATTADGEPVKVDLTGARSIVAERGDPRVAEIWKGLRFRFQEVTFDYGPDRRDPDGKHMVARRSMPVEYVVETAKSATKKANGADKVAAAKAKAAAKKAEEPVEDTDILAPFPSELADFVREQLAAADDHDTFTALCLENEDVVANDELMQLIVDDGADGVWATKGA